MLRVDETIVVLSDPIARLGEQLDPPTMMVRALSARLGIGWINSDCICLVEDELTGVTVWKRAQRSHKDDCSADQSESDQ
jgi:hypothetical protein